MSKLKPVVLCILDGWGERDDPTDNAIAQARTPHWDTLKNENPFGTLSASQGDVGLPPGQMGNSEVGHMNIGAGRVVVQDLPRIDAAIADGSLATNAALLKFVRTLKQQGGTCHLMGLLSDGGVHAQLTHLAALANTVASHGVQVYVHAFTDGRDVAPKSALSYLEAFAAQSTAPIVTIGGRYYGMDRDKRWERIAKAYAAIVQGQGATAIDARAAVHSAYADDITDEFIVPTVLQGYTGMKSGDGILMGNFRADRARQLLTALLDPNFAEFHRGAALSLAPLGMVEYSEALNQRMPAIFPAIDLRESLPEVVANAGLKQLRIAETEKYAHVTFFFSGGREEPFAGEDRILVPSTKVATYDL